MRSRFLSSSVLLSMLFALLILACGPVTAADAPPKPPATEEEKTFYALGLMLSRNLPGFRAHSGRDDLRDAGHLRRRRRQDDRGQDGRLRTQGARARTGQGGEARRGREGDPRCRGGAGRAPSESDSGIVYTEMSAGAGQSPTSSDTVKVHYRGTLTNGTEFDSSYARNEPAQFPLGGVIKCWTEGVQKMKVGGKARLVCPSDLAYGDGGARRFPAGRRWSSRSSCWRSSSRTGGTMSDAMKTLRSHLCGQWFEAARDFQTLWNFFHGSATGARLFDRSRSPGRPLVGP